MATGKGPEFDGSASPLSAILCCWPPSHTPRHLVPLRTTEHFHPALNRLLDTFLSTFADTDHRNNRRHTDDNAQVVNPVLSFWAPNEARQPESNPKLMANFFYLQVSQKKRAFQPLGFRPTVDRHETSAPFRVPGHLHLVGDNNHGHTLAIQLGEQVHDFSTCFRI
ncbi:MAG: hypothetical protein CM1200mP18_00390 [Gammaproteobacteria bacterium]|nr:MAG: hypothetical protein CM1200mP18_00390 [Gammaproteobacteria bacterium]